MLGSSAVLLARLKWKLNNFIFATTQLNPKLGRPYFPKVNQTTPQTKTDPHFFSAPTQPNSTKLFLTQNSQNNFPHNPPTCRCTTPDPPSLICFGPKTKISLVQPQPNSIIIIKMGLSCAKHRQS